MMGKAKRNKGFTMVELIVVIVIILVLAAVLVPSLLKYIRKAQEAAAIEECAGVVRMAAVERAQWLADGGTEPTEAEIVGSAGANGEIDTVNYSDDDFDVTYMRYVCKNGIVVIYEYDKDPQYHIEGKDESSPMTVIQKWIEDANAIYKSSIANTNYIKHQEVIESIVKNGGLLPVDESFRAGTGYEDDNSLYWIPYAISNGKSDVESTFTILYANSITATSHAGWKAKIVYVDGQRYVSSIPEGTQINTINSELEYKTADEVKKWLLSKNFRLVE